MTNQEAIKKLRVLKFKYPIKRGSSFDTALDMAIEALKSRHEGKWITHGEPPWYVRECSECGTKWHHWSGDSNPNYCGNCGADMRERRK